MEKAKRFEDLWIWQQAREQIKEIYQDFRSGSGSKDYGFRFQVQDAGISVMNNTCPVKQLEVRMYYTYVLQSIKDMNFYVGFTKDLKLRFEQHNKRFVESTKNRTPFKLIYYEACIDRNDARQREKYLKTYHEDVFKKEAQILFNGVKRV